MVIFADSARADLKAIAMWIGADNPDRAATFVAEIHRACESLARHPKRFPLVRAAAAKDCENAVSAAI
jgi:plasmid stabilization system protein ParE